MFPEWIYPQAFSAARRSGAAEAYLSNPSTAKLAEFFEAKGLPALKEADQNELWYDDWLAYQTTHRLYASVLAPKPNASSDLTFDLLNYARFLEVFGHYSPAHGYSLQVTFLGLFAILLGTNSALKTEALAVLEEGGVLALGVSERNHGSDLLANEFTLTDVSPGRFLANGSKYYIGNSNCASIISILGQKEVWRPGHANHSLPILFGLRPKQSKGFGSLRKIRTLGVRSAFVGEFEVKNHELPQSDLIADGRGAWDAVIGTVTLGKFFLGFGAIGICEHALDESAGHLNQRALYAKSAMEMPHIRFAMAQAYARLTAMKLYAYRALDYLHASSDDDRRYIFYCAVQKAQVSTEGVKVMDLLSECVGAKGFESDTYFEMALRDSQLFPGLEGSTHINLVLTTQFISRYFAEAESTFADLKSVSANGESSHGNPYLTQPHTGALTNIKFPHFLKAYKPLASIPNVRLFAKQAKAFQLFMRKQRSQRSTDANLRTNLSLGKCLATIAYGQLIAENAVCFAVPAEVVSTIFHLLVNDLTAVAITIASSGQFEPGAVKALMRHATCIPKTADADWGFISKRMADR
jgi:acyl-CoA dehydrogenase